jgi:ribose/xylose/arabinose/galactoside ABC-type transport system permease subunit
MIKDRIVTLSATILLMCICMSFLFPSQFPTVENFSQIMLNLSIDTIVAVGMMLLMISGVFDLSVGSIVAFSGGLAGYLMYYHDVNFLVAIAAALSGSLLIGVINGFLITKIGINPMIQTLAMMGVVRGLITLAR